MIEDTTLEDLLERVEKVEEDFRLGKISEEEVVEYIKKVAEFLEIPVEDN